MSTEKSVVGILLGIGRAGRKADGVGEAQEVHGACGGDSEGGFWDLSRAFEAEHSCSSLCQLHIRTQGLLCFLTTELISQP